MKWLRNKLWRRQEGVAMLMVLGFMAISIPIVTGYLAFTGTLSKDSQVKTNILTSQYASKGCSQYAAWRLSNDPAYVAALVDGDNPPYNFDGCTITVNKALANETTEEAYADLSLVLDVSGSVSSSELVLLKQAANQIVDAFSLSTTTPRVRIGVTRFRGSYEVVQGMTDVDVHGTSEPLHVAIDALQQGGPGLSSGTNIVAGLNGGAVAFTSGLGDRVDPPDPFTVPNLMVFITDGDDSAGNDDDEIGAASLATGATVFAIGVGDVDDIKPSTINAIATDPDVDHAFSANDFTALLGIINSIVTAVYGAAGTLYTITSVSADGTVVVSQVFILAP